MPSSDGNELMLPLSSRVVMVEALSENLSTADLMKYYQVCDFPFNFNFVVHLKSPVSAVALKEQIENWMLSMEQTAPGSTANWVVGSLTNDCTWAIYEYL